ncbi:MAG: inositol monophosphatase family protein [Candidatus Babeliaceae bacterium]
MDHVYLACGKVEGLFFENLKWWDFAAGMLLVQEAGGQLSTFEGGPVTDFKGTYVASNGLIHKDLVSFLSQSRA